MVKSTSYSKCCPDYLVNKKEHLDWIKRDREYFINKFIEETNQIINSIIRSLMSSENVSEKIDFYNKEKDMFYQYIFPALSKSELKFEIEEKKSWFSGKYISLTLYNPEI